MMRSKITQSHVKAALTGLAAVIAVALIVAGFRRPEAPKASSDLKAFANVIVATCAKTDYRQACYDREIPKLMDKGVTMEQAFDVVKLVQSQDDGYWFCHAVAHKLSENEYYKDPSKWADVMGRCEVGLCSNGCLHGALQAHFSSESLNGVQIKELMPDLQKICEKRDNWDPTPQQQSSCYHELGHLSMYLTDSDINAAAGICDTVGVRPDGRNYLQTCHEGIFMQVFEPREPDDFALIRHLVPEKEKLSVCDKYESGVEKGACWKIGWKDSYQQFCNQFSGDVRYGCFREAWVVNDDKIASAEGITAYCSYAAGDSVETRKCYNKVFFGLMASFDFDISRMRPICTSLPKAIESQCFADIASRLVETDKNLVKQAVGVCADAAALGTGDECYKELISYAHFIFMPESGEAKAMCAMLPATWQAECSKSPSSP